MYVSVAVCICGLVFFAVGACGCMWLPSNRANQQLLPECQGIYLSESREAIHGWGSPRPQLEKRNVEGKKGAKNKIDRDAKPPWRKLEEHCAFLSFLKVFMPWTWNHLWKLLNFDLNKSLASLHLLTLFMFSQLLLLMLIAAHFTVCLVIVLFESTKIVFFCTQYYYAKIWLEHNTNFLCSQWYIYIILLLHASCLDVQTPSRWN